MNLFIESTFVGILGAVIGSIIVNQYDNIPYKEFIPCILYGIVWVIYFGYKYDEKDKPCFFGDCEKKKMIGNFVIYDDLNDNNINDNNINDNNINDNIVETFIKSDKFMDKKEGYVFKTGDQGTGYYLD
jgi:hypothetical protein